MSLKNAGVLAAVLLVGVAARATASDECVDCHGQAGASAASHVPTIGGLSEQYLLDSMTAYRERQRPCPQSGYPADPKRPKTDMCTIAAGLSAGDTTRIAQELAGRPFVRAQQPFDAAKAAAGRKVHEQQCEKCHSEGASLAEDDAGILAGQWTPYLRASFGEFATGARAMPAKMKPKFQPLSPAQREALLHYYASQQ